MQYLIKFDVLVLRAQVEALTRVESEALAAQLETTEREATNSFHQLYSLARQEAEPCAPRVPLRLIDEETPLSVQAYRLPAGSMLDISIRGGTQALLASSGHSR